MLCRTCGNLVKIRGDRWECPYCYDCGRIRLPEVQISLTWELSCKISLPESWSALKTALAELKSDGTLEPLLGKVLLHEISAALRQLNAPPSAKKTRELEVFLNSTPELHLKDSTGTIMKGIRSKVLYTQEAELTEQSLGSFWAQLLATLPPEQYYDGIPDALADLQRELAYVWAYFAGADDNDICEPLDRERELEDAFQLHWQEKALLHPDLERAKELLSRGEFPANEDICRNILVAEYPEEAVDYSLEELEDRRWEWILDDVFERDAAKALQMWRTLLDVATPCLDADPVVAEKLLHDWDVLESASFYTAEAFFTALADESFVNQVFASAHVGHLQQRLLELCCKFDRAELGERCLNLALEKPYTTENWERRWKRRE